MTINPVILKKIEPGTVRSIRNTDEPKLAEEFDFVLEHVFQAFSKLDFDGRFTWVNNAYARTLGYTPDELTGKHWWITVYPDDLPNIVDAYYHMLETGRGEGEARAIKKDGSHFWKHLVMVKLTDDNGNHRGHYWFMTDITERKDRELELKRIALTDELTGLYNRHGFFSIATEYLERSKRLKRDSLLIFIDIDGLKVINDRFGHICGDAAICAVAGLIQETFRSCDVFARIGGDEFVVLVNETKPEEIIRAKLFSRLDSINSKLNRPWEVAISVGYLLIPPDQIGPIRQLAEKADSAMYAVKNQKKCNKYNGRRNQQALTAKAKQIPYNSHEF